MKLFLVLFLLAFLLFPAFTQDLHLPIFYLKYDFGIGIEEDDGVTEQTDDKHKASFRIKERWSNILTTNLTFTFYDKNYVDGAGDYNYYSLYPEFTFRFNNSLKLDTGFRSKWVVYENTLNDYTDLMFKTTFTFKPIPQISLIPSFQGTYSLYNDEERSKQTYVFGFGITTKLNSFVLSGSYRGTLRNPLNSDSTVNMDFYNQFSVGLTFDPNKIRNDE